ncbi:Methyltransferase domain-containing protein [Hymenobacter daecheongensis DSM 21074]|uniref:Methyltransferase domain-containing protein n=1 Tax=Hymenobacter daecheongensis DSM 21074 TaxID=1121955 RepID=A0A1M6DFB3_9BACT|nr:class I SAM-dependent methyltransferase [Hymenobacter daecheongensis]SHI71801.1 Methyltransferase domain-containing protein [Hymenobacter daecheongensis DSM 21074]
MNYNRIYQYRFQNTNAAKKQVVWTELATWLYNGYLNRPQSVLDPAGGLCEFINAIPAAEKWTIDLEADFIRKHAAPNVNIQVGNNLEVDIPQNHFDAVFISNFLEHLNTQVQVAALLGRMYASMKKGGRIVVMGPNFRHTYKEYFDFADHTVILTEMGVAEHLYGAGFKIIKIIDKFLPLSFRSGGYLPVTSLTVKTYLNISLAWRIMGKQFLVVAEK